MGPAAQSSWEELAEHRVVEHSNSHKELGEGIQLDGKADDGEVGKGVGALGIKVMAEAPWFVMLAWLA